MYPKPACGKLSKIHQKMKIPRTGYMEDRHKAVPCGLKPSAIPIKENENKPHMTDRHAGFSVFFTDYRPVRLRI